MRFGLVVAVLLGFGTLSASAADLTVTVTGLRSGQGTLRIAVFDSEQEFPRGEQVVGQNVPAISGEITVIFEGLPIGSYAIAVHHDEDDDGKMDTGLLGIPQEGYAFSNNAVVFLGPPPFSDAAFHLPDLGRHVTIQMDY